MQGTVTLAVAVAGVLLGALNSILGALREHRERLRGRDLKAVLHFHFVEQSMLQVEVEVGNRTLDPAEIMKWRLDVRYMTQGETFYRSLFPRVHLESFRSSQPPKGTAGPKPEVTLAGLHSLSWMIPVPAAAPRTLMTARAALRTGAGKWVYSQRLTAPRAGYLPRWVVLFTCYVYAARLLLRLWPRSAA